MSDAPDAAALSPPAEAVAAVRAPVRVRLPDSSVVVPAGCACCGEPAGFTRSIRDRTGRVLLIGYCQPCAEHVARHGTRRLAAALASALLGATIAVTVSIVLPFLGLPWAVAVTFVGASLPLLPVLFFTRPPPGHARRGPAVAFVGPGELVCHDARYAAQLGENPGVHLAPADRPARAFPVELGVPLLAALGLAPLTHTYQHPWLRVINGSDRTLEIRVDGRSIGLVEPSSGESSAAGILVRVPAGRRVLGAIDRSGRVFVENHVQVVAGEQHLYAPGTPEGCFWLERTSYGRSAAGAERVPLAGESRFWVIPDEVSGWFVPAPPPDESARTTGGTTTVLRQGQCDDTRAPDLE